MLKRKKIIFICTGNVFRSYSSDLLMNKFIKDNDIKNIKISSAGTHNGVIVFKETFQKLSEMGTKPEFKYGTQVNKELLLKQDLIICMTKVHQDFIKELGFDSLLFNEVAYGKKEDLLDEHEFGLIHGFDFEIKDYIIETIDYINKAIPFIIKNLESFSNEVNYICYSRIFSSFYSLKVINL